MMQLALINQAARNLLLAAAKHSLDLQDGNKTAATLAVWRIFKL
jgi:hypothetical protein